LKTQKKLNDVQNRTTIAKEKVKSLVLTKDAITVFSLNEFPENKTNNFEKSIYYDVKDIKLQQYHVLKDEKKPSEIKIFNPIKSFEDQQKKLKIDEKKRKTIWIRKITKLNNKLFQFIIV